MFQIQNITTDPKQRQSLVLPDGTSMSLSIYFSPMQLGWFIYELIYLDFILTGMRICNSPDILYQYRNRIPFGLACVSDAEREPALQQDFFSGASKLYILTQDEVNQYKDFLSGQVQS